MIETINPKAETHSYRLSAPPLTTLAASSKSIIKQNAATKTQNIDTKMET